MAGEVSLLSQGIAALAAAAALAGAWKGLAEYSKNNALKRFEKFQELRKRRAEDENVRAVSKAMDDGDDEAFGRLSKEQLFRFMSFFEEVALMVNSRLMSKAVAHYMFGYDVIATHQSEVFWQRVSREELYWSLFSRFCADMNEYHDELLANGIRVERLRF